MKNEKWKMWNFKNILFFVNYDFIIQQNPTIIENSSNSSFYYFSTFSKKCNYFIIISIIKEIIFYLLKLWLILLFIRFIK